MKKAISLLLLLALLSSLWACGSDPHTGIYKGVYAEDDAGVYRMEDYYNGENYLELKNRGKAIMMVNDSAHELTWELNEGEITFTEDGDPFTGWLSEGVIQLDYMGWGIQLTFALEGAQIPETTVEDPVAHAEALEAVRNYWNGDWYGWWYISTGTGAYAQEQLRIRDAAAQIELDQDGRGPIVIWDMEHSREKPLADCILRVDPNTGELPMGIAMSGQGQFRGQPVLAGDWLIDPSVAPYDNLLEINGYYSDEEGDFFYTLFLRPWGQSWEDVAQAQDPDVFPAALPEYYDIYLEALAAGTSLVDFFR